MGMDLDYLAAKDSIEELEKMLLDTPHGEREEIADAIIDFVEHLRKEIEKNHGNTKNR